MAIYVRPDDVAAGWRPLTDAEVITAQGLIDEVTVLLRVLVPGVDELDEALVRFVAVRMIRRVMKNPGGYRIRNESIDDYSDGGTIDSALSTGELYVSDQELGWLGITPAADAPKRAFEVRLGGS
jgi:hypothetical protein